ncbi:metallophosphoesterase [Amycolatopsis minnesotensis]|uniref:metallophosphoesterase n=1 Tax=Amycolatopsis minnesotensis TaxID=337894 RepID=UPI0031E04DFF
MSAPVSSENRPPAAPPRGRRRTLFAVVLVVVLVVLFGVPWWTLFRSGTGWPAAVVIVGTVVFAMAFVAFPVAMFLGHSRRGLDWAARIGDTLLGIVWVLFVWSLLGDVLRLVLMVFGVENPLRGRVVAIAVVVVAAALLAWGHREATRLPRIKRVDVPIARLGRALDGLTVAVITDTHLGPIERSGWSAKVAAAVNALDADVVVHAGDIADGSVEKRRAQAAPLGTVRARLSKVYITGNHEYFGEAQAWLDHMAELGWEPLHNRHVLVERGGESLVVAGVDDATAEASRVPGHGANLAKALDGADPALPVVLAAHQPKQLAQAVEAGVDLQISGHTHGGQIWPFHYLVRADQPSVHGLTRHGERTQLYTSRGTGFWGPPFRIFAPSEITLLTLRASGA